MMWDETVSSVWYNYKDRCAVRAVSCLSSCGLPGTKTAQLCTSCGATSKGVVNQRWFDNATSLALKYGVAKTMGLRGVGALSSICCSWP